MNKHEIKGVTLTLLLLVISTGITAQCDGEAFACDDQCMPLEWQCDNVIDCKDGKVSPCT
jgi:hypothetical protein